MTCKRQCLHATTRHWQHGCVHGCREGHERSTLQCAVCCRRAVSQAPGRSAIGILLGPQHADTGHLAHVAHIKRCHRAGCQWRATSLRWVSCWPRWAASQAHTLGTRPPRRLCASSPRCSCRWGAACCRLLPRCVCVSRTTRRPARLQQVIVMALRNIWVGMNASAASPCSSGISSDKRASGGCRVL